MSRVILDKAAPAVKKFVQRFSLGPEGVELELAGRVIGKFVPASQLSEAEIAEVIARGRALVRKARARNEGVPARIIEREVRQAVAEVRGRQRR
jgi:hypothetical protein